MTDKAEKTKATKAKAKVKMELVNPKKIAVPKPKKVVVAKPKANAVKVPKKVKDKPLDIFQIVDLLQAAGAELKEGGSKAALAKAKLAAEEARKYLDKRPNLYLPENSERKRLTSKEFLAHIANVQKHANIDMLHIVILYGRFLIDCVTA